MAVGLCVRLLERPAESPPDVVAISQIACRERLGGLLKHYSVGGVSGGGSRIHCDGCQRLNPASTAATHPSLSELIMRRRGESTRRRFQASLYHRAT